MTRMRITGLCGGLSRALVVTCTGAAYLRELSNSFHCGDIKRLTITMHGM